MEFLKRNKFRLFIVFIAIMLLLGVYTIVKGEEDISVISIGGKKWTKSNINDNEKLLKVLSRVTKHDETKLIEQIPDGLEAGYNIGWTGKALNSLNWNGCIGCTYQNDWWTTMLCVEPTSTISTAESNIEINSIVFISPTKIKGYKDGGATIEKNISKTELTIMQQYLKQSYLAQSDLNEASNFRKNNTYKALADKIYSKLGSGYWATCSSLGGDGTLPTLDTNEEYYGIFVYVGKKGAGQDRVIWHTIKKDKVKDVKIELNIKKTDTSGNIINSETYGKASFTITAESNATIGTGKKSEVSKTSNDFDLTIYPKDITKSFKLKIKETSTPKSFLGLPSDGVTLTVEYDKDGKVTNIDAGANNSYFKFTIGNVGVIKVKNKTIPPLTMNITKKVDGGTPQGTFVFNVTYEQQGSTSKTNKITLGKTSSGIVWNGSDDWQPKNSNNVKVTIKEECNDENYEGAAEILIEYRYNSTNENWDVVSSNVASGNLTTSDHKTYKLTVKNHYNPPIRLRFYKKDITGSISLQGAKMKIAKTATGSNIKKITYNNVEYTNTSLELVSASSSNNGVFQKEAGYYTVFIRPEDSSKGYVKLDITELVSPTGYNLLRKDKKPVTMTVNYEYDAEKRVKVKGISVEPNEYSRLLVFHKNWENEDGVLYGIIRMKNDPRIIKGTKLYKYDKTGNNAVEGATFTAEFNGVTYVKINGNKHTATDNKVTVTGLVVKDSSGLIANIQEIEALEDSDTVYMTVTETKSVSGFSILPKPVNLVFKYDKKDSSGGKWKLYEDTENNELPSEFFEVKNDELTLNIKDDYKLDKLTILKTDSQNSSTKLPEAKFDITLSNIKSAKGYSANASGKIILTGVTTDANGNIVLEDLVISNINNPITITIEEKEAPVGYKKLEGTITVTLTRSESTYKVSATRSETMSDSEFKTDNVKIENNEVVLNINNIPVMNLGGIVWEDGQTGNKAPKPVDGKIGDKEPRLPGVQVTLYKEGESNPITTDIYGEPLMTKTATAGYELEYKMCNGKTDKIILEEGEYIFPNLEKGANYYVVFTYDGINYQTTKLSGDLYKDNNESKVTEVSRDAFNAKFKTISDSTTKDTNTNSYAKADGSSEDLVYSYVGEENGVKRSNLVTTDSNGNVLDKYKTTAKSANYLKDVADWKATWTDDGKINKSNYALDINCGLLEKYFDLTLSSSVEDITYTINGKTLEEKSDDDSEPSIRRDSEIFRSDYTYRYDKYNNTDGFVNEEEQAKRQEYLKEDTELEVYVTYKITVATGSTYNANVNEILYNYSDKQEIVSIESDTGVEYSPNGENSIIIKPKQKLTSTNNAQEIYITLKLKKDADRNLPTEILNNNGLDCVNTAEIISYTTDEGGLIDNDSAPGNYLEDRKNENSKREDDETYTIVNFKIKEERREISGNVAEANKNGELNEKNINDVIVQLIEVIQVPSGQYLEYIWQETQTGSSTVRARGKLNELYTYDNGLTGDDIGQYRFLGHSLDAKDSTGTKVNLETGFIPGNYIIRFIYGDGSTYDVTQNVKQYNGQDYKSATDLKYKEEWYNPSNYGPNNSVARDNEARRLKVMSYSITINKDKWEAIENKTSEMLENTWMCAETSKIDVGIDTIKYDAINFGLEKRPETKLVLEKHITGLKITPTGTGVQPIVDAKLKNIVNILNENIIEKEDLTGITTGLSTIKSSRDERGFWKVETDIEELAQGATLEVEYTYVIKDESDVDYLSTYLVEEYKNDPDNYSNILINKSKEMKKAMREGTYSYSTDNIIGMYLGQYYYTKNEEIAKASDEELPVLSRVDTVEDYLENQLKLSEQNSGVDFKKTNTENVDKNMYDAEGKFVKNGLKIETVIQNKEKFNFLRAKANEDDNKCNDKNTDYTKTVSLTTTLSASNKEIAYPGYIAQIMQYSNAAGRRDMDACPANLNYIHSEDSEMTLDSYVKYNNDGTRITDVSKNPEAGYVRLNEDDEYWGCGGERIMVGKPTGEDKQEPLQIAIIAISSIAVLGVGIVLIKKFVLKK